MTYNDARLLQDSLGGLADTLLKVRMLNEEKNNSEARRLLASQELGQRKTQFDQDLDLRKQELAARVAMAQRKQEASITAYIADPDNPNQGMTFTGTPEQFQNIKDAATKSLGKSPLIQPKPPSSTQHEVASFTVGGATHKFYDKASADDFEAGLKAQGIDPNKAKGEDTETIIEEYDAEPGSPAEEASSGFFGIGAHPAKPAVPATPKRKVIKKVPTSGVVPDLAPGLPNLAPQTAATPAATASSNKAVPTPKDVAYLAAHPEMKDKFEARFGAGSADQYLP